MGENNLLPLFHEFYTNYTKGNNIFTFPPHCGTEHKGGGNFSIHISQFTLSMSLLFLRKQESVFNQTLLHQF